ncbi:hypothetical protein MBLNU13_g03233t1 [Cladosporium sp. NU13]
MYDEISIALGPELLTAVDELHRRGIYGKGVKVGIVDTGIWYKHEDLGKGFGEDKKVAGGWDFVVDGWAVGGERKPDGDPLDENGHGTHVAGIPAGSVGNGKGVAPEAELHSYKVFGPSESTSTSIIIEAFIQAYEDSMDIITASLGSASGYSDNPLALVANCTAGEGVIVTVAAGNTGSVGPFYPSNGGAGNLTLSIASADVNINSNVSVPDIAAPGRDIFSAWAGAEDVYNAISGTSMATPYIARVAAPYLSEKGGASPVASFEGTVNDAFKTPTFQVGAGLVDARKVVDSRVSLGLQRFALNDTRHTECQKDLTIRNNGNTKFTFDFDLESAAGYEILQDALPTEPSTDQGFEGAGSHRGQGECSSSRQVRAGPWEVSECTYLTRVLGFELSEDLENVSVGTYPWLRAGFPPKDTTTFSLNQSVAAQSYPKIFSKIKRGSREIRWDGNLGSAASWAYGPNVAFFNPAKHNASDLISFPIRDQNRNALVSLSFKSMYYWSGSLANGTLSKPGTYTMRYAVLKPFSETVCSSSWSTLTKEITLRHKWEEPANNVSTAVHKWRA